MSALGGMCAGGEQRHLDTSTSDVADDAAASIDVAGTQVRCTKLGIGGVFRYVTDQSSAAMDESSRSCSLWDPAGCVGTPLCPPRCPRFFDREGTAFLMLPFEDDDREELVSMYERLGPESRTRGIPPTDRPRIETWLADILSRGWNLVAKNRDAIVGHVGVVPATACEPEGLIFVDEAYQGRGIGGELLRQLIAYAATRGHEGLMLDVSSNNRSAIGVFRAIGFEITHRNISEVQLSLSLDDPLADEVRLPPAHRT